MLLVKASQRVSPNNLGEILQDVVDPLVDDVGRLGLGYRAVKEHQELPQSRLVHDIDLLEGKYRIQCHLLLS